MKVDKGGNVRISSDAGDSFVCTSECNKVFLGETEITLSPASGDGYIFVNWELVQGNDLAKQAEQNMSIRLTQDTSISAHFIEMPRIEFAVEAIGNGNAKRDEQETSLKLVQDTYTIANSKETCSNNDVTGAMIGDTAVEDGGGTLRIEFTLTSPCLGGGRIDAELWDDRFGSSDVRIKTFSTKIPTEQTNEEPLTFEYNLDIGNDEFCGFNPFADIDGYVAVNGKKISATTRIQNCDFW